MDPWILCPDQGIKPSPTMRNVYASHKIYLTCTPPVIKPINNTPQLKLMEEKLQLKLQPPVTPETLTYKCQEGWLESSTVFLLSPALCCRRGLWTSCSSVGCPVSQLQYNFTECGSGGPKRTIQSSSLLPAGTRLLPIVCFPYCFADFEMPQARRFLSLPSGDFFCGLIVLDATMAFISLCSIFLCFVLFPHPQSHSFGCVPHTHPDKYRVSSASHPSREFHPLNPP